MEKDKSLLKVLALTGVLQTFFYLAHVIAGRMVWKDYNPLAQPISDLTADTAISQAVANNILYGYSFFNIFFCIVLLIYFNKEVVVNKIFYSGLVIKFVAELLSTFGYKLFPLSDTAWQSSFQNTMHYVITAVIVLGYIVLSVLLTIGLAKTKKYPGMTRFMKLFSAVFIVSGFMTVVAANVFPMYVGLVERVNLYSLMSLNVALALWMFNMDKGGGEGFPSAEQVL